MEKKGEEDALGRDNNELGELTNLEETEDEEWAETKQKYLYDANRSIYMMQIEVSIACRW